MAVVWCREKYGNEATFDSHADGSTYRKTFLIKVEDAQADRELTIINDPKVTAKVKLLHPWEAGADFDQTSFALKQQLRQDEDHPELYEMDVEFGPPTIQDEGGGGGQNQNPLADPPEVEWGFTTSKQGLWILYRYEPEHASRHPTEWEQAESEVRIGALNSAKEPFDPQPDYDDHILTLTVTRNEPTYNPVRAIAYAGAKNSDTFLGVPPGMCLMLPWRATRHFKNGVFYNKVRYEIHFSERGWDLRLVDHGSYYWDASALGGGAPGEVLPDYRTGAKKIHFRDEFQVLTTGLLNGRGGKLAAGADPVILTLKRNKKAPFSPLGL